MMDDWVGTTLHFDIEALPTGGTELRFRHAGLTPRLECFTDCQSGWDHFIPSIGAYVETGVGNPNQSEADLARRGGTGSTPPVGDVQLTSSVVMSEWS